MIKITKIWMLGLLCATSLHAMDFNFEDLLRNRRQQSQQISSLSLTLTNGLSFNATGSESFIQQSLDKVLSVFQQAPQQNNNGHAHHHAQQRQQGGAPDISSLSSIINLLNLIGQVDPQQQNPVQQEQQRPQQQRQQPRRQQEFSYPPHDLHGHEHLAREEQPQISIIQQIENVPPSGIVPLYIQPNLSPRDLFDSGGPAVQQWMREMYAQEQRRQNPRALGNTPQKDRGEEKK